MSDSVAFHGSVGSDHPAAAPVAVVGASCRLPGGVDSLDSLWGLLLEGKDTVGEVPPDRWGPEAVAGVSPEVAERMRWGCFLERGLADFAPSFFGISPDEAPWVAPEYRLFLEVVWEACENAGLPVDKLRGTRTGLFTGVYGVDYVLRALRPVDEINTYYGLTGAHGTMTGRTAFLLDLRGPAMAVDTACSSGLVALHLACQSLRAQECDLALAGGAQVLSAPETMMTQVGWGMLSPTGHCHSFDADADGFVRGEGSGVVVLKRLADAQADGDRILAVLPGSAVNQNGRGTRLTTPSQRAQEEVFHQALRQAGVDAADVGMVEGHGPGTPAGDPVEFASTAAVYGQGRGRCALGSVKTNIGHLEPMSGIAALLKTIVSLRHGTVPASLHFNEWNPQIEAEGTRLFVPTRATEWPVEGTPRLAAVSSYGLGGTNAHVIVEQPPVAIRPVPEPAGVVSGQQPDTTPDSSTNTAAHSDSWPYVMPLSAGTSGALRTAAARLASWLEEDDGRTPLSDVAHTLAVRRSHAPARLAAVAASRTELAAALTAYSADGTAPGARTGLAGREAGPGAVWVFSGQGSQWARMGRGLWGHDEAFTRTIKDLEPLILKESGFLVSEVLAAPEVVTGIARVQPALYAMQVGLAAMWRGRGLEPAAVIGHSLGEVAAAVVAGVLTAEDGARVVCRRSRLMARIAGRGAMASVQLGPDAAEAELEEVAPGVNVAVSASPSTTVVAGDPEQIEELLKRWDAADIGAARVAVDVAAHSPQIDEILGDVRTALSCLTPGSAAIPFYSTVHPSPRTEVTGDAAYWAANLRQPVRFADAVAAAAADGFRIFVEVAPHPLLTTALQQNLDAAGVDSALVLPTLLREQDERHTVARHLAEAYCAGCPVDWSRSYGNGTLADVPATVWEHDHYLLERPVVHSPGVGERGGHPLLGLRVHGLDPGDDRHWWQPRPTEAALPWLADHRVEDVPVLPGAGFCEMAYAAARDVWEAGPADVRVDDVQLLRLLPVAEESELIATATPTETGAIRWELVGLDPEGNRTPYATALLHHEPDRAAPGPQDLTALTAAHPRAADVAAFYAGLRERHRIEHGDAFAGLTELNLAPEGDEPSALARIGLNDSAFTRAGGLNWHPALLDTCLQTLAALWADTADLGDALSLPTRVGSVRVHEDTSGGSHCLARIDTADAERCVGRLWLLDEDGRVLAEATGVVFSRVGDMSADQQFNDRLLRVHWQPHPLPAQPSENTARGRWLLLAEDGTDPFTEQVADLLRIAGNDCAVAAVPAGAESVDATTTGHMAAPDLAGVVVLPGHENGAVPEAADLGRAHDRVRRLALLVMELARHTGSTRPRLWAVTRSAQEVLPGDRTHLAQSGVQGLMRVLSYEHSELCPTVIDLDDDTGAVDLTADLLTGDRGDDEISWRAGTRYRARLGLAPMRDHERRTLTCSAPTDGYALRLRHPGDLDSFELVHQPRRTPGPGEVEVRIAASGLNFLDVLVAMGLYPTEYGIGIDCAGTVTALGEGVDEAWLGRRVASMVGGGGGLSSYATTRADWLLPVPDAMSPEAAAGLPAAYVTVWYSLCHLADLRPGQTVLIHSATGGVGLAAVRIAQARGATILATAGTGTKRKYLRELGITTVMDSRSLDFAQQVREATGGRGVDVVLNSLTGQALKTGLDLVAPEGHFIEIGKRDIYADTRVGLYPFRRNISFHSVDFALLADTHPTLIARLLEEISLALAAGEIGAAPHTDYPVERATEAFRVMANAEHIGRLTLTWPDHGTVSTVQLPEDVPVVRDDGSYVITGGLGGLGLLIARWLADLGAASIVLCSRSAPSEHAERILAELRESGTRIATVSGDIADPGVAERLVAEATAEGHPLRGVMHAAAVVEDVTVAEFDPRILDRVWRPKVTGAWRLHEATRDHDVDWWTGFSSIASLYGSPGQGSYAAANAALDEFCAWRRAQGLKATSVNWGLWAQFGRGAALEQRGYSMIDPAEGIRALESILRHARPRTGYAPRDISRWLQNYLSSMETTFFADMADRHQAASTPDERETLDGLHRADDRPGRLRLLERHIADNVAVILRIQAENISSGDNLAALGLDSLMALELRTRLEHSLTIDIPRTVIWTSPTMAALAAQIEAYPEAPWAGPTQPAESS
ncbi:SDR family NAD(P)-dependent oxidoreductase [Streptomyces sp. NPDC088147]|uniref:SDR family NAD(P)-dependent oxidoreductase n=1 Tax=Streptomyces sp. NPDC088147 TaxID=3365830 RepID=UPI003824CCA3